MTHQFEISLITAATVVVSTVGIYLTFVVLLRISGPRTLMSTSSVDFACVVAFGAILGRTVLLFEPTLAIGVVALTTFVAMQTLLGYLLQKPALSRWLNRPPLLLAHTTTTGQGAWWTHCWLRLLRSVSRARSSKSTSS